MDQNRNSPVKNMLVLIVVVFISIYGP